MSEAVCALNVFRDYVLEFYKMASGVTRDETAPKEGELGGTLGSHLPPLFRALNVGHSKADLVVAGEDTRWRNCSAPKVRARMV